MAKRQETIIMQKDSTWNAFQRYSRTKYKTIDKGKSLFKKRRKILFQMKEKNERISGSYKETHPLKKSIKEPVRPGMCQNDISLPQVDDKKNKKEAKEVKKFQFTFLFNQTRV
ncbi:hypothetical protein NPIL_545111 [Nephila pilipes]|uniref:Uncharacterized protein n=1 Tax=Nephila pilipes TaxID=299642 RepID=A0A8X6QW52_NEPPI|nr:hypothetical protein NPIL_545111 [Nephila pilipes]